jgi:hypothetical protein
MNPESSSNNADVTPQGSDGDENVSENDTSSTPSSADEPIPTTAAAASNHVPDMVQSMFADYNVYLESPVYRNSMLRASAAAAGGFGIGGVGNVDSTQS